MSSLSRAVSVPGGRNVLLALGALYVASATVYSFLPGVDDTSAGILLIIGVFVGGPGLALLYAGYRLPGSDIRPEFYATVATWCVGAIGLILTLLALIEVATGLRDPLTNVLILTALASIAGLGAGMYDARAKSRARELEVRNQELQRTKDELQETVAQLRTSNERLEQFAYAASHDLQEPLRMVSSYLQLLDNRYGDDLDDEAREYIDFAVGGADRMRSMVDSLLAYSRISTQGEPLEPTDADAVLETTLHDLQERIDQTEAEVTSDDLPTVTADPDQLGQVFQNLLTNALRYSGDARPRVHVGAERVDDGWRFAVRDEGIGIDPEYQDQIFEVFERLHTDQEGSESTAGGIGLALCERIVERHGGDIWVDSEPGEGSTFYFTLPDGGEHGD